MIDENTFINWCYNNYLVRKAAKNSYLPYSGWTNVVEQNHDNLNKRINIDSFQNMKLEVGDINLIDIECPIFKSYKDIIYSLTKKIIYKRDFINHVNVPQTYDEKFNGMSWFKYFAKIIEKQPGYNKSNQEYKDKMSLLQITISKIGNYVAALKKPQTNVYGSLRTDPYAFFSIGRSSCDQQSCFRQGISNSHHKMILGEAPSSFVLFLSLSPLDNELNNIKDNVIFRCFGFAMKDSVFISNRYHSAVINPNQHNICIKNIVQKILKHIDPNDIIETRESMDDTFYSSLIYYNRQTGLLFSDRKNPMSLAVLKQDIARELLLSNSVSTEAHPSHGCCICRKQVILRNGSQRTQETFVINQKLICSSCLEILPPDPITGLPII